MGWWGTLFFSKDIANLEALADKVTSEEEKAAIEKVIEIIKREQKNGK